MAAEFIKNPINKDAELELVETTTPSASVANTEILYAKSDKLLYVLDNSNAEHQLIQSGDSRLTDSRTPTSHNASHAIGGGDKITSIDLSSGSMILPATASALTATEGYVKWDTTKKDLTIYDSQRERDVSCDGWLPYVFPPNYVASAAFTTALALTANGGSIAIPMYLCGNLLLDSVSVRNTDTATARSWRWDLYKQRLNNGNAGENTLNLVSYASNNESFTPAAASTRTITAGAGPIYLGPGAYWLVVQCTHATSNFGLGSTAASAAFGQNIAQTKTTSNPNGSTLDFVLATWTKVTAIYAVRLNGRVFGQTTLF